MPPDRNPSEPFDLPYSDILKPLLDAILKSLLLLTESNSDNVDDTAIARNFLWLGNRARGQDEHLLTSALADRSLRVRDTSKLPGETRVGQLILSSARKLGREAQAAKISGVLMPSPFRILVDLLTVPEEPASRAYAIVTVRTYIMQVMGLRLSPTGITENNDGNEITIACIEDGARTARTYIAGRDNINVPKKEPNRQFVYQIMAMNGLLNFRFASEGDRTKFLESGAPLHPMDVTFEFRKSDDVERIPDVSELINQIWGLPLPIRGADTVFFDGLRFATDGSLVAAVTGHPGTGKTSFGLFLAATLAPMGARTFFVTAEEQSNDLAFRLATLTPEYLRRLSFYESRSEKWFRTYRMPDNADRNRANLKDTLNKIKEAVGASADAKPSKPDSLPCPLIVILDGIQNYFIRDYGNGEQKYTDSGQIYSLGMFVHKCRDLGALVILTFADRQAELAPLEYLVDLVIDLEYRHADRPGEKPVRYFVLRKSRHQLSRPGAHVCHFSGGDGFRIAPQLPSQLDRKSAFKVQEPDETLCIDLLNRPFAGVPREGSILRGAFSTHSPFLDVYRRSHILVYGRGSTGKAGFSLALLSTPLVTVKERAVRTDGRPKVLVISFLYPKSYYDGLAKKLNAVIENQFDLAEAWRPRIHVQHFFPGYLNPEDLFSRINRILDQADLEGEPFTGVLFDGLHNTFLQFPRLEESPMVWPMLYGMLRTRDLTVVSTHTTFSLTNGAEMEMDDLELHFRRAKPVLHALVQASDFYITIDRAAPLDPSEAESIDVETMEIIVMSARGQPKPRSSRYWHRELQVVYGFGIQPQLPLPLPIQRRRRTPDKDVSSGQ